MTRILVAAAVAILLAGCGNSSPGPLQGTWKATGPMPLVTTFRAGETESMDLIEKVEYKVDRQSVLVTWKDGPMKGTTVRYVLVAPTTIQAMGMTYHKVGG